MRHESIEIDTGLLRAVEDRTDSFSHRDEWVKNAIEQYLERDDLPNCPDLEPDEYRARIVEDAIRAKLD
jgi:metal-responsive CopG/Arc/MetJ family transcriptional regulator